jgi:curved DNA-binding protein CbpA
MKEKSDFMSQGSGSAIGPGLGKVELETISRLMRTLNFYQILKVSPVATEDEIRDSFHREAMLFHPDQYASSNDAMMVALAKDAYQKVVEAYRILSNRDKRREYDESLNPSGVGPDEESTVDENAITSVKRRPNWASGGPGDKFFKMAEQALTNGDAKSALVNIQIALSSDPNNITYKNFKLRVEAQIKKR